MLVIPAAWEAEVEGSEAQIQTEQLSKTQTQKSVSQSIARPNLLSSYRFIFISLFLADFPGYRNS